MASKIKLYVARKIIESLSKNPPSIMPSELKTLLRMNTQNTNNFEMSLPVHNLENRLGISTPEGILKMQPDDIINSVHLHTLPPSNKFVFKINKDIFIKEVIENWEKPDITTQPKHIIVEYSSPNIAKPFHVGHLRSTIIGNFIANLHSYLNDKVIRLNYLGDWGTQFGYIKVGVDKLHFSDEDIKADPIKRLYQSYVYANKLAETNPEISVLAKKEFNKLESGLEGLDYWKTYIGYTIDELQSIYNRLGVKFDEYNYESTYNIHVVKKLLDTLYQLNILNKYPDTSQTIKVDNREYTLIKSDGSTLYLTRDIAAAVDRFHKHNFSEMLYVVENGQNDHFVALTSILNSMGFHWHKNIKHVKFGRIHGMSTRKGNVVFLKDILDETQELVIQKQIESPNTKVPITHEVADILGASCVIINDLKQKRQKDYEFSWDKVLQVQGDSGIKLQYTHCRLHNLEINCGVLPAQKSMPSLLYEPEILILIREVAQFHDVLQAAKEQLEACILVTYLFRLCHCINKALKVLQVKNQEPMIASQRLLVFVTARKVLGEGMIILGLKPLQQM